jgi:hypothetical protein
MQILAELLLQMRRKPNGEEEEKILKRSDENEILRKGVGLSKAAERKNKSFWRNFAQTRNAVLVPMILELAVESRNFFCQAQSFFLKKNSGRKCLEYLFALLIHCVWCVFLIFARKTKRFND